MDAQHGEMNFDDVDQYRHEQKAGGRLRAYMNQYIRNTNPDLRLGYIDIKNRSFLSD